MHGSCCMKWSLEEKAIAVSVGIILLLLGLLSQVSSKNTTELVENANQIQHNYEVLGSLTDFFAAMTVAESGRRGYIFSGREEDLARYQTAVDTMKTQLNQLQPQLSADTTQQNRVKILNQLVTQRLALLQQSIALHQRDRSKQAMQMQNAITDKSVSLREQIQATLTEIKNAENQQLQQSLTETKANIQRRSLTEQLGTLLISTVIFGVICVLYWGQQRQKKLQALEQTLAQERELSDLKLRLFSMISHEFRTPLSVILASSQLLGEILETQTERIHLKNLYRIQTSAKLMNHLLTDILTLTRAEAGKLEYKPELLDIEAFCLNLLDDIQVSGTNQHSFRFISRGTCGRVYLDEKLLYSILSNLLLNAIKYSPPKSQIHLTLSCEPEAIGFEVQDEGMGVLEVDREKIFDPFFRGQNAESMTGSGLGLSVVKKCLELCNGTIYFNSQLGSGTTFAVKIPRSQSCINNS